MELVSKSIVAARLREARMARGYGLQDFAEKIGVTKQAVSKYELGNMDPSGSVLKNIVEVLDFPLQFFYKEINASENRGTVYFRSLKSATKKSRDMVISRIAWVQEIYNYLGHYINFPKLDIPDLSDIYEHRELTNEIVGSAALKVREHWGLGYGPVGDIAVLLEKKGFIVSRIELGDDKIDAFSLWNNNAPYIFLGSDKSSAARSRFDIAHELGHILLHSHIEQEELSQSGVLKQIESEANAFAGAFLLPEITFPQEVISTSINHFITLKRRWKVSIAAMVYRCSELGLFTDNQILYLNKQLSYNNMRKKEPLDDILEPEKPTMLKQAMNLILDNDILTSYQIVEDLKLPVDEIEHLCNLPQGTLANEGKVIPLIIKSKK